MILCNKHAANVSPQSMCVSVYSNMSAESAFSGAIFNCTRVYICESQLSSAAALWFLNDSSKKKPREIYKCCHIILFRIDACTPVFGCPSRASSSSGMCRRNARPVCGFVRCLRCVSLCVREKFGVYATSKLPRTPTATTKVWGARGVRWVFIKHILRKDDLHRQHARGMPATFRRLRGGGGGRWADLSNLSGRVCVCVCTSLLRRSHADLRFVVVYDIVVRDAAFIISSECVCVYNLSHGWWYP